MTETTPQQGRLVYRNVVDFVENYLSVVYRRQVSDLSDTVWCPQWWQHTEAIVRLDAVWRAWEHLRQDPATGMSVWFLDHADPHMAVLLDPRGPFKYCSVRNGHKDRLDRLPLATPPQGLFSNPEDGDGMPPEMRAPAEPEARAAGTEARAAGVEIEDPRA